MKRYLLFIIVPLLAIAGCNQKLPKPDVTTIGGVQTAVAEAEFSYGLAMHDANKYIGTCAAAPTTIGCNTQLIAQIRVASDKAWAALQAAENAVKTLPPGATGIDKAIAEANAALAFLQQFTAKVPK